MEVGELRERLRALGYLNAGVDRFVLAPAGGQPGALGLAWRVSVRIGLLAALLLGPAAAIGVAARVSGLITGPRDAVVVGLYLAVLFGGAATLVSFVSALAVHAFGRRTNERSSRRVALASGVLTGVACLAYLTLWWGSASPAGAWLTPWRTAIAIAAAVAISLLLGHAVTMAALAVLARDRRGLELPAPVLSWRRLMAIAAVGVLAASGLLAFSLFRDKSTTRPPDFAVVPTGVRVVLVGIDGFDPTLYARWSAEAATGATPVLERLTIAATSEGASGDPAATWTTVATGVSPERHRVVGLQSRRVLGLQGLIDPRSSLARALGGATDLLRLTRPAPVSGLARRYKMIWETAAEKGLTTAVVNWWATWPAADTGGVVLSDRAVLRLDQGGEPSAEIAPPALYPPLRHRWPEIRRRADALASGMAQIPDRTAAEILARSARLDAQQVLLARDPLLGSPDLLAVYLPGLDIAQYELLQGADARVMAPSALADRVAFLPAYYVYVDYLIREILLRGLPPDAIIIVVAHPGRVKGDRGAVLSIAGGPIRPQRVSSPQSVSLLDVAPTVAYLLGLPVSRELPGEPWMARVNPDFAQRYPLRWVESYGRYAATMPATEGTPLDEEVLERLRSLGYIR